MGSFARAGSSQAILAEVGVKRRPGSSPDQIGHDVDIKEQTVSVLGSASISHSWPDTNYYDDAESSCAAPRIRKVPLHLV